MSRFHKIINTVLTLAIFLTFILAGCRSGGKDVVKGVDSVNVQGANPAVYEELKHAEKIFYTLPSPLESAMLIKSAGALFDDNLLNPIENTKKYSTNKSLALNLGIYTCDLSFASLYDQTQLIIDYMNAAKKMADGLGILDAIEQQDIDKLEENIHNTDVIMDIVSQTYMNSNSYLEDNNQPAIAALVLTGGWLEGLYISTQLVDIKDINGNKLVGRIIDQKLSVEILLDLLESSKGHPAIDELLTQVNKVKAVFDKITIKTSPVRSEFDQNANVTLLKSEIQADLTPEVFKELSVIVAEIRSNLIK
jgi:hypothetical protein